MHYFVLWFLKRVKEFLFSTTRLSKAILKRILLCLSQFCKHHLAGLRIQRPTIQEVLKPSTLSPSHKQSANTSDNIAQAAASFVPMTLDSGMGYPGRYTRPTADASIGSEAITGTQPSIPFGPYTRVGKIVVPHSDSFCDKWRLPPPVSQRQLFDERIFNIFRIVLIKLFPYSPKISVDCIKKST